METTTRTPAEVVADRLSSIESKVDTILAKLEGFEAALEDFAKLGESLSGGGLSGLMGAILGGRGTGRNGG